MARIFPKIITRYAVEVIERSTTVRRTLRLSYREIHGAIRVARRLRNYMLKNEPYATESIRVLADVIAEFGALLPEDDLGGREP